MEFDWKIAGAFAFGAMIGWNVYFVNRYRNGEIGFGDITTLIGAVGGAAVLALYDADTDLFGAYGLGLGAGFFLYFISLLIMVRMSPNFDSDWFLDGRRKNPGEDQGYGTNTRPTLAPMAIRPPAAEGQALPVTNVFYGSNPGEAQSGVTAALRGGADAAALHAPPGETIDQVCRSVWSASGPNGPFRNASNDFVIEVAHRKGVTISGTADQIVAAMESSPVWTVLSDGEAARDAAARGMLVLAGLPSAAYDPPRHEGHLAVVVPGPMNPAGWAPAGFWGSSDPAVAAIGGSGSPISNCFSAGLKDKILYRAFSV